MEKIHIDVEEQWAMCNLKKVGLCPVGMIEVKDGDGINCQTYIRNAHRSGCYTPVKSGRQNKQYKNENSISAGSGTGKNQESMDNAHGRLGCLNGYAITYDKTNKVLKCVKYKNQTGSNIKHCRNRNNIKYELIPVFSNGKLSFECRRKEKGKF